MKTKLQFLFTFTFLLAFAGYSQCNPVTSIDENFNGWTEVDECWSTLTAGALVYQDTDAITFYSLFSPNTPTMLVTPKIVANTYSVSFDANAITGSSATTGLQIQVGTVTDNSDASTFTAIGSPIDLTSTATTYSLEVTLNADEYLVFNATLPTAHSALSIDNVILDNTLSTTDISVDKIQFKIYPNPSTDKKINLIYDVNKLDSSTNQILIYTTTGQKVFELALNNNSGFYNKTLDLSALKSGIYVLQFNSGTTSISKKLVLK